MKEIPILFSKPMVQAILEGKKTQTRRLIKDKLQPARDEVINGTRMIKPAGWPLLSEAEYLSRFCPYGKPGDIIWCRETWGVGCRPDPFEGSVDGIEFKADEKYIDEIESLPLHTIEGFEYANYEGSGWRPSIHMPKAIARIWLKVESVRVERLQDMPYTDIEKEGIAFEQLKGCDPCLPVSVHLHHEFKKLWEKINGTDSWLAQPLGMGCFLHRPFYYW